MYTRRKHCAMAPAKRLASGVLSALKSRNAAYRLVPVRHDSIRAISNFGESNRWISGLSQPDVNTEAFTSGALRGNSADVAIIGGGIVGLAVAREIVNRFPKATVCLVEKEKHLVEHQTSHNRYCLTRLAFDCSYLLFWNQFALLTSNGPPIPLEVLAILN